MNKFFLGIKPCLHIKELYVKVFSSITHGLIPECRVRMYEKGWHISWERYRTRRPPAKSLNRRWDGRAGPQAEHHTTQMTKIATLVN